MSTELHPVGHSHTSDFVRQKKAAFQRLGFFYLNLKMAGEESDKPERFTTANFHKLKD